MQSKLRTSPSEVTRLSQAPVKPLPLVAVCVCTCNRPEGLRRLLSAIAELSFKSDYTVIVVDNDTTAEGLRVVDEMRSILPLEVHGVRERRRGISYARNAGVAKADAIGAGLIVFIDDDEVPSKDWLHELATVHQATGADIVGGPVLPVFSMEPEPWLLNTGCYAQIYPVQERKLFVYSSANVLVRTQALMALGPEPFGRAFALSGGEDHAAFWQMMKRGSPMAWAPKAVVFEEFPPERMTMAWVRQRIYRMGNANVRVQRMLEPGLSAEIVRWAKTMGLLASSLLLLGLGIVSPKLALQGRLGLWKGSGKLAGHFGYQYKEYASRHRM